MSGLGGVVDTVITIWHESGWWSVVSALAVYEWVAKGVEPVVIGKAYKSAGLSRMAEGMDIHTADAVVGMRDRLDG